jgi:4-hydroxy-3-polyprenylbenzoate decarboxylase
MSSIPKRLIVGVSGASGIIYGIRTLKALRNAGIESHLVISKSAALTLTYELDMSLDEVRALADHVHSNSDMGAAISSGSFRTSGMIIAPCSVRTMSDVAAGTTSTLISRSADVVLKEQRRLVLMLRETPLHLGHLRTACQLAEIGAIILPTVPAFYNRPKTLDDIVDHSVGRALDLFDINTDFVNRWKESDLSSEAQP